MKSELSTISSPRAAKKHKKQTTLNLQYSKIPQKLNKFGTSALAREPAIMKKQMINSPKKPSPQHIREYFDVRLDKVKVAQRGYQRSGDLNEMLSRINNHKLSLQMEENETEKMPESMQNSGLYIKTQQTEKELLADL